MDWHFQSHMNSFISIYNKYITYRASVMRVFPFALTHSLDYRKPYLSSFAEPFRIDVALAEVCNHLVCKKPITA